MSTTPADITPRPEEHYMDTIPLTPTEPSVLEQLLQGKTNRQIADALGRAEKTIKAHMTSIFRRTGCTNRLQVMARYKVSPS